MKTFLEHVAHDIINKYGYDLSRVAVVFPNKRAALFMNEYLVRIAGRPIWSPAYITISDLFRRHSSRRTGDQIKLICDLHKCFTECTGIDETLDHFYGWGQLLLADFDDLDKNMAEADKVFANLRDIHELDDVSYLSKEQIDIIRRFFSNFSEEHNSELKRRFLSLWSHIYDIYNTFNERLTYEGLAYEGALYREVAENVNIEFMYDTYLFVGFNVLQKWKDVFSNDCKNKDVPTSTGTSTIIICRTDTTFAMKPGITYRNIFSCSPTNSTIPTEIYTIIFHVVKTLLSFPRLPRMSRHAISADG